MNKRIKRYLEEIEKTEKKIADLQQYLKGIQAALKQEENNEMVKSIRGMKLDSKELLELLTGIQNGSVTFQMNMEPEDKETGSFVFNEQKEEREEYDYDEMEEDE